MDTHVNNLKMSTIATEKEAEAKILMDNAKLEEKEIKKEVDEIQKQIDFTLFDYINISNFDKSEKERLGIL